ncbi:MAG: amidohydrolase family protein [bacterium]|jgi:imidazolonepropionase-like amidohydrolase
MKTFAQVAIAFLLCSISLEAQANVGQEGIFVIEGGTVVVGDGQQFEGSILIRNGRIVDVGTSVAVPEGAVTIDASGQFVYAGMIDSYTPIGLVEIGGIPTMNLRSEIGEYNPHIRALVGINTGSEMIGVTRSTGVTTAITAPEGGVISGQAALINMDGWTWEDMSVNANAGYIFNYPSTEGGGRRFGPPVGTPESRAAQAKERIQDLNNELATAKAYHIARNEGLQETDLVYESMRPLMDGEIPAIVNANSENEILGALKLGEDFGLKIVINGGREAWKVAEQLAAAEVPVILSSLMQNPEEGLPYDAVYAQPGILVEAGVKIAFATGSQTIARHLPYHAALASAYGLSPEDAWKALTVWPAEIWRVDDLVGTLEEGKMANLFITDGDPLDIRSSIQEIFIKGRRVPIDDRHTRLYEKHNARPIGNR